MDAGPLKTTPANVFKTMFIAFFDIDGLVHHESVRRGQTVNKEFYVGYLESKERLRIQPAQLFHFS